jgi:hypothetical protein
MIEVHSISRMKCHNKPLCTITNNNNSKIKSSTLKVIKNYQIAGRLQLTPVILAVWEAEIRMIAVQTQQGQIVLETPSLK